ncbi:hypothetical protein GCM10009801_20380 [Streptomyces albiaxialis]|uniref:Uncharacterized protein n=1 Tax=Streptomyces albiaxialis TaxID=329523 RepID=A0ABN2VRC7_9ACTN
MSMPAPATAQAISAPATPVSAANRPGSENTPAPTIEPTTIATMVGSDSSAAAGAASPEPAVPLEAALMNPHPTGRDLPPHAGSGGTDPCG